ncbi:2,5-dichloro-2,5-cyclohexadiene-1,4-diol dehydrogenase LinX-like [Littorina saxatilis]|uniref:Uncharacterized protein n=1 Tax=Littorina saxatilis TaxID=31220 RepID=A0AAN9C0L0_9CAEN
MDEFKGKVILITGSSSGLGAGTAVHFAARGARLSLTGLGDTDLKRVASKCVEAGLTEKDVLTTVGDLTDDAFRSQLVTKTVDTFGQLDVLVNVAGRVLSGQVSDPGMDSYHALFDLNLTAHVALTKLAVPHLLKVKGNIVNMSSIYSLFPVPGVGAYCMTKAALDMFTKVLAMELAPKGVRVNSVNPGLCRTEILQGFGFDNDQIKTYYEDYAKTCPVGRVGEPEDIARAVAFLASDNSSFITGEVLVVDGGGRYAAKDIKN